MFDSVIVSSIFANMPKERWFVYVYMPIDIIAIPASCKIDVIQPFVFHKRQ